MALVPHSVLRRFLQRIPEPHDLLVRLAPRHLDLVGVLVRHHDAIRLGHRLERADTALVAQRENGHLADLTLVLVVGRDLAVVDSAGRVAVDVPAVAEHVERALLVGQPRQNAGFDG